MKRIAIIGECMIELNGEPFGSMQQSYGGDSLNTAIYMARSVEIIWIFSLFPLSVQTRSAMACYSTGKLRALIQI